MAKKIRPEQMDALVEKLLASPAGQEMAEADRQETLAKRRAALSEIARLENERAEKLPPMQEESEKLARRVTFAEGQFKAARQKHGAAEFALYCARGEIEQAITRQRDILGASAPAELYEAIEQLTVEIFRTQGRFASRSSAAGAAGRGSTGRAKALPPPPRRAPAAAPGCSGA